VFIRRLCNLVGGKFTRWLRTREARDPEAVYEAAISDRLKRYQQLKDAAAGVIYTRNKLESEHRQKAAELVEVAEQAAQAVDLGEDQCALILLRRKQELEGDEARLKEELTQLTAEADEAKKNLMDFKGEIDRLKIEKTRMLARLRNAQARLRIQHTLEQLSYEDDVRALQEVRESIQQTLSRAGVNRELQESEFEEKLSEIKRRATDARAAAELEELKRRRRPPLVPMSTITPPPFARAQASTAR